MLKRKNRMFLTGVLMAMLLACGQMRARAEGNPNPGILPPNSTAFGHTYAEWSAAWWKWFMEFPLDGHPATDSFTDVTEGQTGDVWFLAAPFGTTERTVTIPAGKALFFALLDAEMSSNEGDATAAQQRADAIAVADFITDLFCTIDGVAVRGLTTKYRFASPQFAFTAPNPWIFSPAPSGPGTSVGDGYYLLLAPLSHGQHTIEFGGEFDFGDGNVFPLDMTYIINVE